MRKGGWCVLIPAATAVVLFLQAYNSLARRPDFNQLKILSLSHSVEQGPQFEEDRFYPGYLSASYRLNLSVRIERPSEWDSSLYELPDAIVSYMGDVLLELYQSDLRQDERNSSLLARWEIHPLWVTAEGEVAESPSRIGHFIPTFLLEKGVRRQIGPAEMLDRGRAHLRALLRKMRE